LPTLLDIYASREMIIAITFLILGPVGIYFFIASVLVKHATEIYILWYAFSLARCISSVAILYVNHSNLALDQTLRQVLSSLTDPDEEWALLAAAFAIAIFPQIISSAISGVFGCASPPRYVATLSRMLMLSVMKFGSVMAGIILAELLFLDNDNKIIISLALIASGLGLAFSTAYIYYTLQNIGPLIVDELDKPETWLDRFVRFMTRYKSAPLADPPLDLKKTILEYLVVLDKGIAVARTILEYLVELEDNDTSSAYNVGQPTNKTSERPANQHQ
jgi:hypothetical protein